MSATVDVVEVVAVEIEDAVVDDVGELDIHEGAGPGGDGGGRGAYIGRGGGDCMEGARGRGRVGRLCSCAHDIRISNSNRIAIIASNTCPPRSCAAAA